MIQMYSEHQYLSMIVHLTHSHTKTPFDAPGKQAF